MVDVSILVRYKEAKLENSAINAGLERLEKLVRKAVEPYKPELESENGELTIWINDFDKIKIVSDGLSADLLKRLTNSVQKL